MKDRKCSSVDKHRQWCLLDKTSQLHMSAHSDCGSMHHKTCTSSSQIRQNSNMEKEKWTHTPPLFEVPSAFSDFWNRKCQFSSVGWSQKGWLLSRAGSTLTIICIRNRTPWEEDGDGCGRSWRVWLWSKCKVNTIAIHCVKFSKN